MIASTFSPSVASHRTDSSISRPRSILPSSLPPAQPPPRTERSDRPPVPSFRLLSTVSVHPPGHSRELIASLASLRVYPKLTIGSQRSTFNYHCLHPSLIAVWYSLCGISRPPSPPSLALASVSLVNGHNHLALFRKSNGLCVLAHMQRPPSRDRPDF